MRRSLELTLTQDTKPKIGTPATRVPGNVHTNCCFLRLNVLKLTACTRQTDGHTRCAMQPLGWPHNKTTNWLLISGELTWSFNLSINCFNWSSRFLRLDSIFRISFSSVLLLNLLLASITSSICFCCNRKHNAQLLSGFFGYTHLKKPTPQKNPHFYFNLILVYTLYATNNAIFYCFKAFKALSYWVFVLVYLFFPACPKKPKNTIKPTGLGFLKKTRVFLNAGK